MQALPLLMVVGMLACAVGFRALQTIQRRVLHVMPIGSLSKLTLAEWAVRVLVAGVFLIYLGNPANALPPGHCANTHRWLPRHSTLPHVAVWGPP